MADDNKTIEETLAEIEREQAAKAKAEKEKKAKQKAARDAGKKRQEEEAKRVAKQREEERERYQKIERMKAEQRNRRNPQVDSGKASKTRETTNKLNRQQVATEYSDASRTLGNLLETYKKTGKPEDRQAVLNAQEKLDKVTSKYLQVVGKLPEGYSGKVTVPDAKPSSTTGPTGAAGGTPSGVMAPARTSQRGSIPTARTAFQGGVNLIKNAAAKAGLDLSTATQDLNSPTKPAAPQPTGDPETDRENRRIYAQSLQGWEVAYNKWLATKDALAKEKAAADLTSNLPGGGSGYAGGTTRSVSYQRNYLSPSQARGTIDQVLEQYYGRTPGSSDYKHFIKMLEDAERKNPVKTVTKTTTSASGNSRSSQTVTGGIDATQLAIEEARGTVEGQATGLDGMFRGAMQLLADRIG